jgi:hypothetical protein
MRYLLPLLVLVVSLLSGCPEVHLAPVPEPTPVTYCGGWQDPPAVFLDCLDYRTEADCCGILTSVEPVCTEWHYDPEYPDYTYCLTWANTGI